MNTSPVIHLVSNSLAHPENTASNFKVSYNVPFDLRGKRVALVDATFTKSQPNILQESITFKFHPKNKKSDTTIQVNLAPDQTEPLRSMVNMFGSYTSELKQEDGTVLMKSTCTYTASTKEVKINVINLSNYEAKVIFCKSNSSEVFGWVLQDTSLTLISLRQNNPAVPADTERVQFIMRPAQEQTFKFKLSPLVMLQGLEDATSFQKLKQALEFRLVAYPTISFTPEPVTVRPKTGNYKSITELIRNLNSLHNFKQIARLRYILGRVEFIVRGVTEPCHIHLGGLEKHFGFDEHVLVHSEKRRQTYIAQRPPDMTRGTHHFYIYCSLVKGVAVNDKTLPILATVDATLGTYGQQIVHPVQYPLFVDCESGPMQMVEVRIADDTGNSENLLIGRTKLTLAVQ